MIKVGKDQKNICVNIVKLKSGKLTIKIGRKKGLGSNAGKLVGATHLVINTHLETVVNTEVLLTSIKYKEKFK